MKKLVMLIFLLLGTLILSYTQNSYCVKPFDDQGDFIYPPYSKLKHSCKKNTVKKTCRYQYIYMDSLKMTHGDYYSVLNLLNNVEYFSSKYSIDKICFDTQCYGCYKNSKATITQSFNKTKRKPNSKTITTLQNDLNKNISEHRIATDSEICDIIQNDIGRFCKIKYSYDQKAFLLQIDYGSIINEQTETEINDRFFEIAKDLLIEFSRREGTGTDGFGWPTSISQDVVEKIFEVIPIPSKSSLARYIAQIDNNKSFLLLNPKISLKVDAVELLTDESTGDWQFRLMNSNLISLSKDNNGNIIQTPFLQFEQSAPNVMPDNKFNGKRVLQASSGDMQLSSTLNKCPFVFIQQKSFKKNNINSSDATCAGYDLNMFECNSILLHFDTLGSFYDMDDKLIDESKAMYLSSFGLRNLITPQINILLNGNSLIIPLNTTLNHLKHQQNLPDLITILRLWNGKYVKVKLKNTNEIILLPSDIIIYDIYETNSKYKF
jgi:hypothetical protein